MLLYKSKLLGYLEYRMPALYHATDTVLAPLDRLQDRLLQAVGCSETEALLNWNLAPLATRRDLAMLGLVHRTVLGEGPQHFRRFFRRQRQTRSSGAWTRLAARRHTLQLEEVDYPNCPGLLRRSALGLVKLYNLLPEDTVAEVTVAGFQRKLQDLVKARAAAGCDDWALTLSPRVPLWKHALR